jgi:hypothetical protein
MAPAIFSRRIKLGATVLMILTVLELGRYVWTMIGNLLRFCFTKPELWNTHWRVDDGTEIAIGLRILYGGYWGSVILASIGVSVVGLLLLNRIRRGEVFVAQTARAIQLFGAMLAALLLYDTFFQSTEIWLITYQNASGPQAIRFFYDPSDWKAMLLGAVLFLFGGVMKAAIAVDQENRGFV